ncbi:hypothetical protein EON63_12685 [archaeon]|nr:MAG: hypothetical protein EON63_12685 [archaeon]
MDTDIDREGSMERQLTLSPISLSSSGSVARPPSMPLLQLARRSARNKSALTVATGRQWR